VTTFASKLGATFCENELFYEKFRVIVAITGRIKSHITACATRLVQQLGDDGTSPPPPVGGWVQSVINCM